MNSVSIYDASDIATVASIVAGFGSTALAFRLERHLQQLPLEREEHSWLPVADWLLIAANAIALLLVLAPLLIFDLSTIQFPRAACAAACVLLAGYVFAIQAHYRLIFGAGKRYENPPSRRVTATAEWIIAVASVLAAMAAFCASYVVAAC